MRCSECAALGLEHAPTPGFAPSGTCVPAPQAEVEQNAQKTAERSNVKEAAQDVLAEESRQLLSQLADLKAQRTVRPTQTTRLLAAPHPPPAVLQDKDVARLEAAVASRDRTISVLRQQLAGFARQRTVSAALVANATAAEDAGNEGAPTVSQREPDP